MYNERETNEYLAQMFGGSKKLRNITQGSRATIFCKNGFTYAGEVKRVENLFGGRGHAIAAELRICENPIEGYYGIRDVIYDNPYTIIKWMDGTQTMVCCQDNKQIIEKNGKKKTKFLPCENYSKKAGFVLCICKRYFGNDGTYNKVFKKFLGEIDEQTL